MPIAFGNARDGALSSTIVAWKMPEMDVSERTDATRRIGAAVILEELMSGDLGMETQYGREMLGEAIGRIVANAERHGIAIQTEHNTDIDI